MFEATRSFLATFILLLFLCLWPTKYSKWSNLFVSVLCRVAMLLFLDDIKQAENVRQCMLSNAPTVRPSQNWKNSHKTILENERKITNFVLVTKFCFLAVLSVFFQFKVKHEVGLRYFLGISSVFHTNQFVLWIWHAAITRIRKMSRILLKDWCVKSKF